MDRRLRQSKTRRLRYLVRYPASRGAMLLPPEQPAAQPGAVLDRLEVSIAEDGLNFFGAERPPVGFDAGGVNNLDGVIQYIGNVLMILGGSLCRHGALVEYAVDRDTPGQAQAQYCDQVFPAEITACDSGDTAFQGWVSAGYALSAGQVTDCAALPGGRPRLYRPIPGGIDFREQEQTRQQ